MKVSMCTAVYGMQDLKTTISKAAHFGFDAVELTAALHTPVDTPLARRKELKGWIHSAGLECSALHYIWDGSVKLATSDPTELKRTTEYLKKVIDVASDMEAKTVIVGSGGKTRSFEPGQDRVLVVDCMADVIRTCGGYAKDKGVILACEAINRYETSFLNTMQEATEFVEKVNHPNVRTMADTYHMNIEEVDPVQSILKYGHALGNLHLADSNRQAPGMGHFDFKALADAMRQINYSEYYSFEVFGLYPWKLWFDTVEEADRQMESGVNYVRSIFD